MKNQKSVKNAKRIFRVFIITLFFAFSFLLAALPAFAEKAGPQTIPCPPNLPCITQETQKTGQGVRDFIVNTFGRGFLTGFLGIAAVTAVIFIIIGGLQLHLAMGNEEALGKARKTIQWAVLGLVVAILSAAIVQIVSNLFNKPS